MIAFGYFGYALGQTVFAAARSVPMLLAARTISGLLNGALQVNALAYLISVSDSESRGKYMAYYAMLSRWAPASATSWAAPSVITA